MDLEVVIGVEVLHLEGREGEEGVGEVVRPHEVDLEVVEGSLYSTVQE
jgi:hypothetical protein